MGTEITTLTKLTITKMTSMAANKKKYLGLCNAKKIQQTNNNYGYTVLTVSAFHALIICDCLVCSFG